MSTPAAKRRRLDTVSATLSRPFRSPFKTPLKPNSDLTNSIDGGSATHDSALSLSRSGSGNPSTPAPSNFNRPLRPFSSVGKSNKTPTPSSRLKGLTSTLSSSDPEIAALLKEQRLLEQELTKMKIDVEMLRQAKKIEETGSDEELEGLIRKWRVASRAAAEVVFGDVKERVNRYVIILLARYMRVYALGKGSWEIPAWMGSTKKPRADDGERIGWVDQRLGKICNAKRMNGGIRALMSLK